jgi:DNA-binding LytR/AlgR family response regulator
MALKCVLVEDDLVARTILSKYIERNRELIKVAEFETADEVLIYLKDNDADILFVDINLPGMSGMELVKQLNNAYEIIFVTAEEGHAVEAFAHRVTDYLLKPIEPERFEQAIENAAKNINAFRKVIENQAYIFVKSEGKYIRILLSELLYIEALADYVIFNTGEKKHIVHYTMKGIEKQLPLNFSRVHRSYIINTSKVEYIEDQNLYINKKSIPIGASYKDALFRAINIL